MKEKIISMIVPCYNEEKCIPYFMDEFKQLEKKFNSDKIRLELIFINDGSKDNTLKLIKEYQRKNKNIHYLSFSRNFGKEAAIYAGLKNSHGNYVTIWDADLQEPISLVYQMYELIVKEKCDMVGLKRKNRHGEPLIRSFFAKQFYKIINKLSKFEMVPNARDACLMSRQIVNAILQMEEYNRYSKGLLSFVGFDTKWIEYENQKRVAGKTKWNFWQLLFYAFDGIIAFSTAPLVIATILGLFFCVVSFIFILVIIFKTLIFGDPVSGWPSLVCIIFFVFGFNYCV